MAHDRKIVRESDSQFVQQIRGVIPNGTHPLEIAGFRLTFSFRKGLKIEAINVKAKRDEKNDARL